MSIRPLSHTEMKNLREAIENNGWQIRGLIENYFRYSIKKDKILIFTIKYPVNIPLRINIPFEVANFRISFAFKLWDLNTNSNKLILILLKLLRNLAIQISLEHDFPIKGKETEFLEILNLLMPEPIKDENDNTWINRIRISLMNKRDEFSEFDTTKLNVIVQILKNIGLNPTFKLPWELKKGVPKIRSSETLFFSNEEKYDEFFILEKGFFTYFKDLEYKKFYIRSSFQTYTPYILFRLFSEIDFKQGQLIEKWIKFSRLLINSVIEIIDIAEVNQQELIKFNPERELTSDDYEEGQNNFPFSALHYESSLSKRELYTIHNDLFNTPPANFEVIETMKTYYRAEELLKNYRFEESTELFNDALKIFNKNRQKKIVAAILLKLSKIGLLLNQNDIALNYLQTALGIAKSGDVPIECIIRIHYNLGITFFQLKDLLKARQHFEVITNFLEKEHSFSERDEFLGLAYLYLGLITAEFNELADSKNYFNRQYHYARTISR